MSTSEQQVLAAVPRGLYIGGEWRDGGDGTFAVEDPATGTELAEVADGSAANSASDSAR